MHQDAQRQEALLAPLTEDQRAEVRRLHRETPWSLEECVQRVTEPLAAAFPTPAGLDRLMAAVNCSVRWPDSASWCRGCVAGEECYAFREDRYQRDAQAEEPADIPGPTSVERRPRGPFHRLLAWVYGLVCNAYARALLRDPSFTLGELRDLHSLADEELPPHLAAQAQRLITAEISRRTRKDY